VRDGGRRFVHAAAHPEDAIADVHVVHGRDAAQLTSVKVRVGDG
jgi:hypothetical protein